MGAEQVLQAMIDAAAAAPAVVFSPAVKFIRDGGEPLPVFRADDVKDYDLRGGLYVPKHLNDPWAFSSKSVWDSMPLFSMRTVFGYDEGTPAPTVRQESSDTEIVGWRCWRLKTDERPELQSLHHDTAWDTAVLRATQEPTVTNVSGIYALDDRAAIGFMLADFDPYAPVYGEVALSGTVIEGSKGFRGECAVIRSLFLRRGDATHNALELADALAQRYAVAVELDVDARPWPTPDEDDED